MSSSVPSSPGSRRPRTWMPWAIALLVVLLVAAGVVTAVRRASAPSHGASATPTADASGQASTPTGATSSTGTRSTPTTGSSPTTQGGPNDDGLQIGPTPAAIPRSGTGSTTVLDVGGPDSTRRGRTVRYTVEIEGGLGLSGDYFAQKVRRVLQDPRGWEVRDGVHFVNVSPAERAAGARSDIRVILASPEYVDRGCLPLDTAGRLSCHSRGRVLLNADRWAHGAQTYGDDVVAYRTYLVSHEVGHSIGHSHATCPRPGAPAPVMVQQTKTLMGCRPGPYPVPTAG